MIDPGTYSTELNITLTQHGLPTIEAQDNPPSGDLFNIKISDLFNDDDRQAALQLQQQLTHQLGHTMSEIEQLVDVIEKERQRSPENIHHYQRPPKDTHQPIS